MAKQKKQAKKAVSSRASKTRKDSKPVSKPGKLSKQKPAKKPDTKQVKQAARTNIKKAQANIAVTRKQVAERTRNIKALVREASKASTKREVTKQVKAISKTLGRQYKTLTNALKALKKEIPVSVKKPAPGKKPVPGRKPVAKPVSAPLKESELKPIKLPFTKQKKVFEVHDLTSSQRKSVEAFLGDIQTAKKLDAQLLKAGEYWAAEVPHVVRDANGKISVQYARTYNLYQSSAALFRKLADYARLNKATKRQNAKWLNTIRIMKFSGTGKQWDKQKAAEVKSRKKGK